MLRQARLDAPGVLSRASRDDGEGYITRPDLCG
jgi:hypothetical protein